MGKWHEVLSKQLKGELRGARVWGVWESQAKRGADYPTSHRRRGIPLSPSEQGTRTSSPGDEEPFPELFLGRGGREAPLFSLEVPAGPPPSPAAGRSYRGGLVGWLCAARGRHWLSEQSRTRPRQPLHARVCPRPTPPTPPPAPPALCELPLGVIETGEPRASPLDQ